LNINFVVALGGRREKEKLLRRDMTEEKIQIEEIMSSRP